MIEIRNLAMTQGQSIKDAYDHLYQERSLALRDSFYLWLLELIHPAANELIVDVACGSGRLVELATRQGYNALGIDLSYQGLTEVAAVAPASALWLVSNGEQIALPDACADCVLCIGSLEHYDDPQQGAAELARILKPQGRACIILPNLFGLFGNIQYMRRHGEVFDDGQPRQRYATRGTWERIIRRAGLTPERTLGWSEINRPRTRADLLWLVQQPQKIARAALANNLPANYANHVVFLCSKSSPAETSRAASHYITLPDVAGADGA